MIACPLQIRFADVDMAGHVHNAVYLHYFESGRMHFFVSQLGENWDWQKYGIILKKNEVVYHQPTQLGDQIKVNVECTHIGTSSFTLSYQVLDHKKGLMAEGSSTLVCFDYTINQVVKVHEGFLPMLKKHFCSPSEA